MTRRTFCKLVAVVLVGAMAEELGTDDDEDGEQ